jgi:hypothetical protein
MTKYYTGYENNHTDQCNNDKKIFNVEVDIITVSGLRIVY